MDLVTTTHDGGLAEVVLNRPKVNAMNRSLLTELRDAFVEIRADDSVTGVLLRGEGRCLSAGLDLFEVASLDEIGVHRFLDLLDEAFGAIYELPQPVAVAVTGHAIAGGAVIALAADHMALQHGEYKFGLTELAVGVPFPRTAFEIVREALPPRALHWLVNEAGTHAPETCFEMGIGDTLVDDAVADAKRWLALVTPRSAATWKFVKAARRKESLERIAATTQRERADLVAALMTANDAIARFPGAAGL